ncbi:hypothetical protein [Nocardioides flavescens]|uniref:Uncharacterized protein n=1 Tax=Nocardioides flavescens TaxID=2691959 RepID=A0A6L7F2Y3_9ACTN|nr:hypothetical protein [Nocardioides flavescens]MXG90384.1 hypothetical protein [Nocardioides flavescens]
MTEHHDDDTHTDRHGFDTDDELRALLRTADPARTLAPADQAAVSELLEDIMSTDLDARPDTAEATPRRGRTTWLVAAAAATVIAGAAGLALSALDSGSDPAPSAGPSVESSATAPSADAGGATNGATAGTTELTAPTTTPGRCAAPSAPFIAAQQQAFEGTVTAIEGDRVTLQTSEVFTGEVGQTVVVDAPAAAMQSLIQSTQFEVGGTYLVSATDGQVAVCGFSGRADGELQGIYDQAFPR